MEQQNMPQQNWDFPSQAPTKPFFPTGKREIIFGVATVLTGWLLCSSIFFGGFNLGYAIAASLSILLSAGYLLLSGCKLTGYSGALLALSLVTTASFARSDDGFVKFVMLCFLLVSINLGLCLLARQNLWQPGGFASVLDAPRTMFYHGLGKLPEAFQGLGQAFRRGGTAAKRSGAVLLGLLIAVPILCILLPLLISADAAFEAVIDLLPQWDLSELIPTALFGSGLAVWMYTRGAALRHTPKAVHIPRTRKGISALTVNTVLVAVALVYLVYLVSQLAYFSGGLFGILPEEYTLAEYARRGFFEMAWLCALNLLVMALSVGLVAKREKTPLLTRLLCLFLGLVTLFLVVTASAKMFLYIGSFGLTRLRVLTEVIMVFLGITTLLVTVWLFVPKLPYMKAILLVGLVMGAAVAWADVDTVVAHYNVTAYQTGRLESVDVWYLGYLGDGAVPYLDVLKSDSDPQVAGAAADILEDWYYDAYDDFRGWNYTSFQAKDHLPEQETADEIYDSPEDTP